MTATKVKNSCPSYHMAKLILMSLKKISRQVLIRKTKICIRLLIKKKS